MGDFNVPNIDWQECMCLCNNSSFESKLLNVTLDSFLLQHVINFTRHTPGQRFSILDLIFTNDPNSIDNIENFLL